MEIPEPLVGMVSSARRRLWGSRLVGDLTVWLGVGACGAAALWGLSRVVVLPWSDQAALLWLAATVVGGVGWWAAHRPTTAAAALWADQRLGADDRLATAWELSANSVLGPAARRQIAEAGRWAEGADRARMGGEYPSTKVVTLAATAVAAAVALAAAPSVTDRARAEQQEVRQTVDRELERVENLAAQGPDDLSERLTELAEILAGTQTVEEAISALSSARLDLEESLSPNRLAENTALEGLATRLAQSPVGLGDDPASQLFDLASGLGGLSAAELAAAAGELAERAADFAGINDELASALAEAAAALAGDGFDLGQAADALGRAASEVSSAGRRAASANAMAEAAAALGESEGRLRNARSQGAPNGAGQGSGRGGDSGQGAGRQGAGSGSQGQGAGAGGQGGGGGAGGGGRSAGGGQGRGSVTGVGDNDPAEAPRYSSTVFEPPVAGLEEEVRVAIEGDGPGVVSGSAVGPSVANQSLVPFTERLAEYRSAALASLERRPLPSHLTEVVQSYFTELEP